MTECSNSEVRDLLPDYIAECLPAGDQALVDGHLAVCAACRAELALLRVARAVRPLAVDVDVSRIVAALPMHSLSRPQLVVSHGDNASGQSATRTITPPPSARSGAMPRRSRALAGVWRMAAAIGVVAIGSWSVLSLRDSASAGNRVAAGGMTAADSAASPRSGVVPHGALASTDSEMSAVRTGAGESTGAARTRATIGSALSLGDLSEYSDEELQRVLDGLEKFDGATSVEPLPSLPIVPVSRGML